jgi:hypothetical protein
MVSKAKAARDGRDEPGGEVIVYQSPDGQVRVDVHLEQETVWLTQAQMAKLFSTTAQNITLHLKTIYADGELEQGATCKDYLQVRRESALAQRATCARCAQVRTEGGRTVTREVHRSLRGHDMRAGGVKTKKAMPACTDKASKMSIWKRLVEGKDTEQGHAVW